MPGISLVEDKLRLTKLKNMTPLAADMNHPVEKMSQLIEKMIYLAE